MKRPYIVAVVAAILVVVAFVVSRTLRRGSEAQEPDAVQWPFDTEELGLLMDRVIESQDQIIDEAPDPTSRSRASAFRDYYERRRAAV